MSANRDSDRHLTPISHAAQLANKFLFWYIGASIVWILVSDQLLLALGRVTVVPDWAPTAKGILYITGFGLALRHAARVHVEAIEIAHQAHVDAGLELVHRLALAAEYRDDQTGGHNERIGCYAAIVGQAMGYDENWCQTLAYAAALHDIGKIGIPDCILLKAGPLCPEERQRMEMHTLLGAKLLADGVHPMVRMAHQVALTHHEKWDGTGYPDRLAGEAIPIEGRIVAVCDVFDALTNDRPYKKAWTMEDALAEIIKGRGAHFDPQVVDSFVACLHAIQRAREEAPTKENHCYRVRGDSAAA